MCALPQITSFRERFVLHAACTTLNERITKKSVALHKCPSSIAKTTSSTILNLRIKPKCSINHIITNLFFIPVSFPRRNYIALVLCTFISLSLHCDCCDAFIVCGSLSDKRFSSQRIGTRASTVSFEYSRPEKCPPRCRQNATQILAMRSEWFTLGSIVQCSFLCTTSFWTRFLYSEQFFSRPSHSFAHAPCVRLCHFIHKFGLTRDNSIRFGPFSSRTWTRL